MTAPEKASTAVATTGTPAITARNGAKMSLSDLIDSAGDTLRPLLAPGNDLERLKTEVFFAVRKTPAIARCTPESVVRAVATVIRRDLVIGETIHLVPMKEKYRDGREWKERYVLNAWNDWKGDIELILRAGAAQGVKAMPVFANEKFEYIEGLESVLEHHPSKSLEGRGALAGAYVVGRIKFGYYIVRYMPLGEIEAVRAKSQQWGPSKVSECPPWYAIKTAVHAFCNRLPKNPKLRGLLGDAGSEFEGSEVEPAGAPPVVRHLSNGHPTALRATATHTDPYEVGRAEDDDTERTAEDEDFERGLED